MQTIWKIFYFFLLSASKDRRKINGKLARTVREYRNGQQFVTLTMRKRFLSSQRDTQNIFISCMFRRKLPVLQRKRRKYLFYYCVLTEKFT